MVYFFFFHGFGRTKITSLCKKNKNILDELFNLYEICGAVNKSLNLLQSEKGK